MKRVAFIASITFITFATEAQKLRVAVASSLLLPFQEIEQKFESDFGIEVDLISGSSGSLTTQVINGAPYDLFISANKEFPDRLFEDGLSRSEPQLLVNGQVYFWSRNELEKGLESAIDAGSFQRIAVANPELAPYGNTAKDWMVRTNRWDALTPLLVFGNAIGQVNHYIFTNAVDGAFSSNSAAYSDQLKAKGYWYEISGADISLVPYFFVVVTGGDSAELTTFIDFIANRESRALFERYGFIVN